MKSARLLALLLCLAMLLSVSAFAVAPPTGEDYTGKVVIIHTNDTHGGDVAVSGERLGTAGIAQLKKDYEAAGAQVLLLSAGDATQGDPLVNLSKGKTAIEFMNAAGYDLMVPGNHEFDWGTDNLLTLEKAADFPLISANIRKAGTGDTLFNTYATFDTKLGKIGVFGLTTPQTSTSTNPNNIKTVSFDAAEALYADAAQQVKALEAAGCKYIICVGHMGLEELGSPNRSSDVINKVPGIDIFIDGHSHMELGSAVSAASTTNETILVSAGTKTEKAGVLVLDGKTIDYGLISAADYSKSDAAVAAAVKKVYDEVDAKLSEKFAVTEVLLDGNRDPGVRTTETNLGDFAADALLWSANFALGEGKVDAAITNGGGIRASIAVGDVTMKDMATVFPFSNTIATVTLTGAQLLEALEAACASAPQAAGAFPQVSGIEFTLDTGIPFERGELYEGTTNYAPAKPGTRVINVKVGGEILDLTKTYTIATNDFTAAGGDTYGVFKACKVYDTGVALEDALVAYTSDVLSGKITAEKYGKAAGRITLMSSTPAIVSGFTDVLQSSWYAEYVKKAVDAKLMSGVGGNLFDPDGIVSRAMVVTMLYRLEGEPTIEYIKAPDPAFADISGDEWFAKAAEWAALNGIVEGIGTADGKAVNFAPNASVSREQLSTMLYRYEQYKDGGFTGSWAFPLDFSDRAAISSWAYEGVCWMTMKGVMQGSNGAFSPAGSATRAQLAKVFTEYSALERVITQTPKAA